MSLRARVSKWTLALTAVSLLACSRSESARPTASTPTAPSPVPVGNAAPESTAVAPTPAPQVQPVTGTAPRAPAAANMPSPVDNSGEGRSGTANPFDEHGGVAANTGGGTDCQRDDDCVCGIDRSTGACAIGPASRVDTARQCPDFCSGIGGQLRVVCDHGRCTQH